MNRDKQLDGALCAGEQRPDAAPAGAKKYVKPTCKVFRLDCQMLAASAPQVTVGPLALDYYLFCRNGYPAGGFEVGTADDRWHHDVVEIEYMTPIYPCDYLGRGNYHTVLNDRINSEFMPRYDWFMSTSQCMLHGGNYLGTTPEELAGMMPGISFERGLNWPVGDFILNAQLPNGCYDGAVGTYNGQRFVLKL